jgi:ethanolamine utilization protein EutQ (cupin superfamily)
MDNTNNIKDNAEKLLMGVRQTVMVTNLSLATALDTPFMATYENDSGILVMALRTNNTAIMAATGNNSNTVIQSDIVITEQGIGERRSTFQCETEEDADQIWELLNDKMYEWSKGEVEKVELDWLS